MSEIIKIILQTLGSASVAVAVLGYLGKKYIDAKYKHKEIQFQTLRTEQLPIIREFYQELRATYNAGSSFAMYNKDDTKAKEKRREFKKAMLVMFESFSEKKIYFPDTLCDLIVHFLLELSCGYIAGEYIHQDLEEEEKVKKIRAVWKFIETDASESMKKIDAQFKSILGV
jgi:hypothetical protein